MIHRASPSLPAVVPAALLAAGACLWAAGCASQPSDTIDWGARLDQARERIDRLQRGIERLRDENHDLQSRVETLQAIEGKRIDLLYRAQRVQIGRHSGPLNQDDTPADEAVQVFIQPIDQHGSVIKAAGEITIELYALDAPPEANRVYRRTYTVQEAAELWSSGLLSYHYSVECPLPDDLACDEITIRVKFVDYLTGKTLSAQKVVEVHPPAGSTTRPAND